MLVATSGSSVACATFKNDGPWIAASYSNPSPTGRPSVSLLDAMNGIGVFYQSNGATGPVRQVTVVNGACAGVASADAATTKAAPTITVHDGTVKMLFRGVSGAGLDRPIFWSWTPGGGWMELAAPIPNILLPTIGGIALNGTPLAANGAEMLMAHGGYDVDKLFSGRYTGGAWQGNELDLAQGTKRTLIPAIAPLGAGKWLVVSFPASGTTLRWGVVDAVPPFADVPGSNAADDTLSLAPTASGAVLAYRDATNGNLVTMAFDAGTNLWSTLPAIPGAPKTSAAPALAKGRCAHAAELVFIDAADGLLKHTWLDAGAWQSPVAVENALTGMANVAISALP